VEIAGYDRRGENKLPAFLILLDRRAMLETPYRRGLVQRLEKRFPGCFIIVNDPNRLQGIPDLQILWNRRTGFLETKRAKTAKRQPNQEYYVDLLNELCFAAFIHPENEEEVLDELERSFKAR
jgi:hypothetical protein